MGKCVLETGGYVFNTEAHPIDPSIVYCCSEERQKDLEKIGKFEATLSLLDMLGLDEAASDSGEESLLDENDLSPSIVKLGKPLEPPMQPPSDPRDEIGYEVDEEVAGQSSTGSALAVEATVDLKDGTLQVNEGNNEEKSAFKQLSGATKVVEGSGTTFADALEKALLSVMEDWQKLLRLSNGLKILLKTDQSDCTAGKCPNMETECRIVDRQADSKALNRFLNAIYGKGKYGDSKEICEPMEQPKRNVWKEEDNYRNVAPDLDETTDTVDDTVGSTVDEIKIDHFSYRELAKKSFELMSCPARPFLSKFTGLGQVMLA